MSYYRYVISYTGIYNWLYSVGFSNVFEIYNSVITYELIGVTLIRLGNLHVLYSSGYIKWIHRHKARISDVVVVSPYRLFVSYLECLSLSSIISYSWFCITVALRCGLWAIHLTVMYTTAIDLEAFYTGYWIIYSSTTLSSLGGLKSNTVSIHSTDIVHHHLGISLLIVWQSIISSSIALSPVNSKYKNPLVTLHISICLVFFIGGALISLVCVSIASLAPYPYLLYDYITCSLLNMHHTSIASIFVLGCFAHVGIFLIRDVTDPHMILSRDDITVRILSHKAAIISHLTWVSSWLVFHTLAVYIHNDTLLALLGGNKSLLIEPVFAQIIQEYTGKALYSTQMFNIGQQILYVNRSLGSVIEPSLSGDLLAVHSTSLGLHITILILLKGSLDARKSKLMPDKINVGFHFSCDGPARSGTCDISAWDSIYLATFWSNNSGAWITFYFNWKHITLWQNTGYQFDESSSYLNACFRDYLWFNSSALIDGYNTFGVNDLSIWDWIFLGAHLSWATSFMFLISWRGYWAELIDTLLYMHLRTPILYNLLSGDIYTPVAISIVQARFIGLVHFSTGFILTYAAFMIGTTS